MEIFYVMNLLGAFISPLAITSVIALWLCIFFKKETLLTKIYGEYNSLDRHYNMVGHHMLVIVIAISYILSLCLGLPLFHDKIRPDGFTVSCIVLIYLAYYIIISLASFVKNVRKNIKPS